MRYLLAFAATFVAFTLVDVAWLALVANAVFKSEVGALLRVQPNLTAAAVFYPVYACGLVLLAVLPALRERSAMAAIWRGAVLGLTAYATFDLTNLAILKGWTLSVSLFDMTWGTCVSALASCIGYFVASRVKVPSAP